MPNASAVDLPRRLLATLLYLGSGWILYLLIVLSMVCVAVALERLWHFIQHGDHILALSEGLRQSLEDGGAQKALHFVGSRGSHAAYVAQSGLVALPRGAAAVEEVMAGATLRVRLHMERGVTFLGTLGNNAPFIGLFGTVLGIIRAFADLSQSPQGGSAAVMAGIAEALVTTAVGLLVALPAVTVFNFFMRRSRVQLAVAQAVTHVIMAHAKSTPKYGGAHEFASAQ